MDKKQLSERDICTKFITPAVKHAGWDEMSQIREEVGFTKGRIIVRGKLVSGRLSTYFTGVGIKHFTGKGLAVFTIPLPPLADQRRIVAKVDELMAVCDRLESQLTTAQTESRRLLEAVLHEALASRPVLATKHPDSGSKVGA